MATNITDWAPEILPWITGVPVPAVELAVRNSAIEFCEKTLLWEVDLDRISVVADTRSYDLTLDALLYGEIIGVDMAKYKQDGQEDTQFLRLDPMSPTQLNLNHYAPGSWEYWEAPTPTRFWSDMEDKQIHLFMIPTEASASGLLVKVNAKPDATTTTLPDFLYRDWRTVIGNGALADLFGRVATPWYNEDAYRKYKAKFIQGYNGAKWDKISGATKRPSRVNFRRYV